jgi:hypothetical protein
VIEGRAGFAVALRGAEVTAGRGLGAVEGGGGGDVEGGGGTVVVVVDVLVVVGSATAARSSGSPDLTTCPHACSAIAAKSKAANDHLARLSMVSPRTPRALSLAHLSGVFVFARQAPRGMVILGAGAALWAGLDADLGAALEGPSLFEAPMSTFLHVPPALPGSACVTVRFYRRRRTCWLR